MTNDSDEFLERAPRVIAGHLVEETGSFREYVVELEDGTSARLFTLGPDAGEAATDAFGRVSGQWRNANSHPNVVSVLDHDDVPRPWIAVPERPGERLDAAQSGLGLTDARSVIEDAAEGLRNAALYNAVHLTLSPESVWVFAEDGRRRAAVGGWGLRYAVKRAAGEQSTDGHLAPELLDGASGDDRTVVYGLGVVSYFALTGRYPDEHELGDTDSLNRTGSAPPTTAVAGLPADVDDIVLKALASDPDDRYQSSFEFKQAISTVLPAEPAQESEPSSNVGTDAPGRASGGQDGSGSEHNGELTEISGVGERRAAAFRRAGYETLEDLDAASMEELRAVDGVGTSLANRIKASDPVQRQAEGSYSAATPTETEKFDRDDGRSRLNRAVPSWVWWLVLVTGTALWWAGMVAGVFLFEDGTRGYEQSTQLVAISWFLVPPSLYFDRKTVLARSAWRPSLGLYLVGALSMIGTGLSGLVYLRRRRKTEFEPNAD